MASAAEAADTVRDGPSEDRLNRTLSASMDMQQAETQSTTQSKLTVCQPYKIDAEMQELDVSGRFAPSFVSLSIRWIVTFLVAVAFLTCLVASKLSIVTIASYIQCSSNSSRNGMEVYHSHLVRYCSI
jgi:hypothetical protein